MDDATKQKLIDLSDDLTGTRADLEDVTVQLERVGTTLLDMINAVVVPNTTIEITVTRRTDSSITVNWTPVPGAASYMLGRDGKDSTGAGTWTETVPIGQTTYTFQKLLPGTLYNLFVVVQDGTHLELGQVSVPVTTMDAPVVTPPVTVPIPTGTRAVLFRSGVDDLAGLQAWEKANGVSGLGLMRFVPRKNEAEFLAPSFWDQMGQVAATGRTTVIALPWAPVSGGPTMNQMVASGDYDEFHRKIGALVTKYNLNRPNVVFRLSWEYNGNWYPWSTVNGGVTLFRNAWDRTVSNLRTNGADKVLWDQCANKGPQSNNPTTGADVFIPGKVDIVGIDHYNMWPAQNSVAGWAQALNQVPGIQSQKALAALKSVRWSVDESGPVNPAGMFYGGDSSIYAEGMIGAIRAGKPFLWTVYDDAGDPDTFHHELSANPVWKAAVLTAIRSGI